MPNAYEIFMAMLSLLESKASDIYNSEENEFWEQLAIKMILVLKRLTAFGFKKGAVMLKQRNDQQEVAAAAKAVTERFFPPQLVQSLVDLLITWYLKLRPADVASWTLEPEEWVNEELQLSWEYQIRPCAENYFQDLAVCFRPQLGERGAGGVPAERERDQRKLQLRPAFPQLFPARGAERRSRREQAGQAARVSDRERVAVNPVLQRDQARGVPAGAAVSAEHRHQRQGGASDGRADAAAPRGRLGVPQARLPAVFVGGRGADARAAAQSRVHRVQDLRAQGSVAHFGAHQPARVGERAARHHGDRAGDVGRVEQRQRDDHQELADARAPRPDRRAQQQQQQGAPDRTAADCAVLRRQVRRVHAVVRGRPRALGGGAQTPACDAGCSRGAGQAVPADGQGAHELDRNPAYGAQARTLLRYLKLSAIRNRDRARDLQDPRRLPLLDARRRRVRDVVAAGGAVSAGRRPEPVAAGGALGGKRTVLRNGQVSDERVADAQLRDQNGAAAAASAAHGPRPLPQHARHRVGLQPRRPARAAGRLAHQPAQAGARCENQENLRAGAAGALCPADLDAVLRSRPQRRPGVPAAQLWEPDGHKFGALEKLQQGHVSRHTPARGGQRERRRRLRSVPQAVVVRRRRPHTDRLRAGGKRVRAGVQAASVRRAAALQRARVQAGPRPQSQHQTASQVPDGPTGGYRRVSAINCVGGQRDFGTAADDDE
ncbi:hypothetical protein KL951_002567 [Ogataea haglerorum]|nr:hypothetical protein KL951_002567 [Ogataea haglerorum]